VLQFINLFSSDCPCRIVICFIESKNKTGSDKLNPFNFQRSWEVTTSNSEDSNLSEREKYLEKKLLDFEKQLAYFKSCVTLVSTDEEPLSDSIASTTKGKGKGKKTGQENASIFTRLRSSFAAPPSDVGNESIRSEDSACASSSPPPYEEKVGATTKIYIKEVQLLLNGAPLDQVETRETGKYFYK